MDGNNTHKTHIDSLIEQALSKLRTMIDVDTVIGKPVQLDDGSQVFPVIKVSVGFVAGGGEYASPDIARRKNRSYPFAGGTGAGFSAEPMGFLIAAGGEYKIVTMDNKNLYQKLFEKVSDFLNQCGKKNEKESGEGK